MVITVLSRFASVDTNGGYSWYSQAAEWGAVNGITDGLNLGAEITREQAAVMLHRAMDIIAPNRFVTQMYFIFEDANEVSDFANEAIQTLANLGWMQGNPDGTFNPQGMLTRAELAATLQRISN